jgi:hypothetical protein
MIRKICLAVLFLVLGSVSALAANVNGKWTADFTTQAGAQKYTYEFKADGATLTGKAMSEHGNVDIRNGKVDGDTISFVEVLSKDGKDFEISYTGKVDGDEIKFTRMVGGTMKEEMVAKRAQ